MARPYKYRELVRILREYDPRFEFWSTRGKGSERIIYHPDIGGRAESHPVKCHTENQELRKGVISSIIRRFKLPKDLL
jgi:predicted RNA binding protein YcfA (HicA-like mRNA interferase family)